jgi:hypothetical protein
MWFNLINMGANLRFVLLFCTIVVLAGRARAAGAPVEGTGAAHVWTLNSYLKGTPEEIRRIINFDLEQLIAERNALRSQMTHQQQVIETAQAEATDKLERNPDYVRLLEELRLANEEFEKVRVGGTSDERLNASFNALVAEQKLESKRHDSLTGDQTTKMFQTFLSRDQDRLKAKDDEIGRLEQWRERALAEVDDDTGFAWPMVPGVEGTVRTITPERLIARNEFETTFEVPEMLFLAGRREGQIVLQEVPTHTVRALVTGLDASGLRLGKPVNLSTTVFNVMRISNLPVGAVCILDHSPGDKELLLRTIHTLNADISPAELQEMAKTAARTKPDGQRWNTLVKLISSIPVEDQPTPDSGWTKDLLQKANEWFRHEVVLDTVEELAVVVDSGNDRGGNSFEINCNVVVEDRPDHAHDVILHCPSQMRARASRSHKGSRLKVHATIQAVTMRADGTLVVELEDPTF